MSKPTFVILLAHGSSDIQWLQPFNALEQQVRQQEPALRLAYMELAEPSLEQVIEEACHQGFREFAVLPLFFAAGRHLRQDVPRQIAAIAQERQVEIQLLAPVGEHPALADALLRIVRETLESSQNAL